MSNINVASINMALMSEKEMLDISHGEVTSGTQAQPKNDASLAKPCLVIPPDSIFSEEIFGICKDSERGLREISDSIFDERRSRFGHIQLPIPYINPVVSEKPLNKIAILVGCLDSEQIRGIINYKRYMFKVPKSNMACLEMIQLVKDKKGVKELSMLQFVDTTNYRYFTTEVGNMGGNGTLPNGAKTVKEMQEQGIDVSIGAYAIISLFQGMNIRKEIVRTNKALIDFSKSTERVKSKGAKIEKLLNMRYKILVNMLENDLTFSDLTHFTVLVTPAADRDVQIVTDFSGATKIQSAEINEKYRDLLYASSTLKKNNQRIPSSTEELYTLDYKVWMHEVPLDKSDFINAASSVQEKVTSLIKDGIGKLIGKKEGIAREEVLSKRSDFTHRGVIVPDPTLKLDEMGVPLKMIFPIVKTPFQAWIGSGGSDLVKELQKMTGDEETFIDDVESINDFTFKPEEMSRIGEAVSIKREKALEKLQEYLNTIRQISIRFPSLHMYSKLGFKIRLTTGSTMKLHPLVCKPFNADFDGDTMSNYVQFTEESIKEIDENLLPSKKILGPSGSPIISLSQDAVLGCYFLTMDKTDGKSEPIEYYGSYYEMLAAYEKGMIGLHDRVSVKYPNYKYSIFQQEYEKAKSLEGFKQKDYRKIATKRREQLRIAKVKELIDMDDIDCGWVTSTVGRFIFNSAVPQDLGNVDRNEDPYGLEIDKDLKVGVNNSQVKAIVQLSVFKKDLQTTKYLLDRLKELGYSFATKSGTSLTLQDLVPPRRKHEVVTETEKKVEEMKKKGADPSAIAAVWKKASSKLSDEAMDELAPDNPLKMMVISGARGNKGQVSQMISMRSIMADATGKEIPTPVLASFLEGMTIPEMFVGSYATRKGIYDKGTMTRETGETTRLMVFGVEGVVLYNGDCGDTVGTIIKATDTKKLSSSVVGKITLEDIYDKEGKLIIPKGQMIDILYSDIVDECYGEKGLRVRSPLSCKGHHGLCCKCYGYSYDKIRFSRIGDPVGIIAAQTLGEPGTQLTLQTFHTGGQAKEKKTAGFGTIKRWITTSLYSNTVDEVYESLLEPEVKAIGAKTVKPEEKLLKVLDVVAETRDKVKTTLPQYLKDVTIPVGFDTFGVIGGDKIYPKLMKDLSNTLDALYADEGVSITSVHFEIFARTMMNRFMVIDSGDSDLSEGDIIDWVKLYNYNRKMIEEGLEPVIVKPEFHSTTKLGMSDKHMLTALMFRDINSAVSRASLITPIDTLTNPMSSTAVANPLPVGDNIQSYIDVIKRKEENIKSRKELYEQLGIPVGEAEIDWSKTDNTIDELKDMIGISPEPIEEELPPIETPESDIDLPEETFGWSKNEVGHEEEIEETINIEQKNTEDYTSVTDVDQSDFAWETQGEPPKETEDNTEQGNHKEDETLTEDKGELDLGWGL